MKYGIRVVLIGAAVAVGLFGTGRVLSSYVRQVLHAAPAGQGAGRG
jgi:hypothetical protein